MNAPLPRPAAAKYKLTLADYHALYASGAVAADHALELVDGDLYEMPDDGARTIDWNAAVLEWLYEAVPTFVRIVPDKTLRVAEHNAPSPDIYVHDRTIRTEDLNGANVLLVIEVSDTMLAFDLGLTAQAYAAGGVRDYWVIDCEGRRTLVHRLQPEGGYGPPEAFGFDQPCPALLIPGLALRLAELALPQP